MQLEFFRAALPKNESRELRSDLFPSLFRIVLIKIDFCVGTFCSATYHYYIFPVFPKEKLLLDDVCVEYGHFEKV